MNTDLMKAMRAYFRQVQFASEDMADRFDVALARPAEEALSEALSEFAYGDSLSDDRQAAMVEATMEPRDTEPPAAMVETFEAAAVELDAQAAESFAPIDFAEIKKAALECSEGAEGTSVFEMAKAGFDKEMVKKALKELMLERKVSTTGKLRGTRYHAVKQEVEAAE